MTKRKKGGVIVLISLNPALERLLSQVATTLTSSVTGIHFSALSPQPSLLRHFRRALTDPFETYTDELHQYLRAGLVDGSPIFLLGITCQPMHGWFSYTDCSRDVCIITTHEWPQNEASQGLESYLIYQIAQNLLLLLVGGKSFLMHSDTRGCLFDFCEYKPDIIVGMEHAGVCDECRRRLDILGYSPILKKLLFAYRLSAGMSTVDREHE